MKKIKNLLILVIISIVCFNIKDVFALQTCNYYNNPDDRGDPLYSFNINDDGSYSNIIANNEFKTLKGEIEGDFKTCPEYIMVVSPDYVSFIISESSPGNGYVLSNGFDSNSQPQDVFVAYLPYNDSGSSIDKILIKKENGSFNFYLYKKNKGSLMGNTTSIIVNGVGEFLEAFQNEDIDNYPTWINSVEDENGKTISYEISKKRDEKSRVNYICQLKILNLSGKIGDDDETCETLFGSDFLKFLNNNVFTIVRLAIPLLLIAFTTFDFAKVVFVDDKDGIQKAGKRFGKRLVAAILIFLIPQILIWLAEIIGADKVKECSEWMQNNQSEINNITDNE